MQKMSSTLFKKVVPQNFVMHFCHNAWRFVATVLRCWTFGDLAWTSGGGVEAQGSPIEGDLTDPRVKNPSFPFISFQLKIATSVCFGWSFLLFRSLVVMISALHLRSCHRFASDFFLGGWFVLGHCTAVCNLILVPSQIARLTLSSLYKLPSWSFMHLRCWFCCAGYFKNIHISINLTICRRFGGPYPRPIKIFLQMAPCLEDQIIYCCRYSRSTVFCTNSKKNSIFASSIFFNCKSTVFLFRNRPFFQTILLSAKWNGILTIKWC